MRIKYIILTLVLIILSVSATAQERSGWTLKQCIDYAIEHNLTVLKSENIVEQTNVEVNTAKWARLPNLSASASERFNWGRTTQRIDDPNTGKEMDVYVNTNSNSTSFSASTDVPLFTGFELPNQYSLAKLNLKAAIADSDKIKEDIAINVVSYFLQVLFNKELMKVAKEQITLSEEQLDRIKQLNEVGKTSIAEVAEVKARLAQDEMNYVQAENNYKLALLDLSQLLELSTPEGFFLTDPQEELFVSTLVPPDEIYWEASKIKPGIRAAQYRLQGSERNIRIAQSGYYPRLSFSAGLSSGYYSTRDGRSFGQQMDDNFTKYLGFNLSIPIFNRFATRNNVRRARLQQHNYAIQLDESKKTLYKEIQQAWYNAVAAESKYTSSASAVEANEEAFRLMKEKFENGKATSLEFNEAKLNLMKALSDRIQAKYEYMFRTKILDFYKGIPIQ